MQSLKNRVEYLVNIPQLISNRFNWPVFCIFCPDIFIRRISVYVCAILEWIASHPVSRMRVQHVHIHIVCNVMLSIQFYDFGESKHQTLTTQHTQTFTYIYAQKRRQQPAPKLLVVARNSLLPAMMTGIRAKVERLAQIGAKPSGFTFAKKKTTLSVSTFAQVVSLHTHTQHIRTSSASQVCLARCVTTTPFICSRHFFIVVVDHVSRNSIYMFD